MATISASLSVASAVPPVAGLETVPGVFFDQAGRRPDSPYLHFFRDGEWRTLTWGETAERAVRVASALIEAGSTATSGSWPRAA